MRNLVSAGALPERARTLRAKSLLNPSVPSLEKRMAQGCPNATRLWRELHEQGCVGGSKVVNRWLEPRREKPGRKHSQREKRLLGLTAEERPGLHSEQPGEPESLLAQSVEQVRQTAEIA